MNKNIKYEEIAIPYYNLEDDVDDVIKFLQDEVNKVREEHPNWRNLRFDLSIKEEYGDNEIYFVLIGERDITEKEIEEEKQKELDQEKRERETYLKLKKKFEGDN